MATRIEADVLIPGAGDPIRNGCVVMEGSSIVYAGPVEGSPRAGSSDTTVSVPAVLPGLWDCHTHFLGVRNLSTQEQVYTPYSVALARTVKDAEKALRAGVTSVRELAGTGIHLRRAVDEGTIPGPHIYASGTLLSPTGGHGDAHAMPIEFVHYWANLREVPGPCDGVPECLRAVRKVLRLGASVVKICASGGVLSDVDDPRHQQFSDEELRAIVEEAARAERIVAAHAIGKAGIMAALRAGVKTIEHGHHLDDEAADLMIEKGAILVPTLSIVVNTLAAGEKSGLPDFLLQKARGLKDQIRVALRLAVRRKVPIAMGSDILGSSEAAPVYWGAHGRELALMVHEMGMTPFEAIRSATAIAPMTLGPQAPKSGQLKAGFAADVIAVEEDPLRRIEVLGEPERILKVWKDGQLAVDRSVPAGPSARPRSRKGRT
ncbi:MAG TPA: amidohydrolase family protein [Thermoplasmata archaeon]|nr:amidohydrolase family protein [Thermoplasmata archaeon]